MVDLVVLQSVSYVAAAIGVCVAGFYYMMMLREQSRSRKIAQTNELLRFFLTLEGQKMFLELMNMEWTDYDDFEKKYGTDTGEEGVINCAKRHVIWFSYDTLGRQLKNGLIDRDTLYGATGTSAIWIWAKFKPVIFENRRRYSGSDAFEGLEYLAGEMFKMKLERDPTYKISETFAEYVPDK